MKEADRRPYRLFEVAGIELEYPTVGDDLEVRDLVGPLFRALAGRPASDAVYRDAVFSNELASHVFEIKTREPERSLARAGRRLYEGVRHVLGILRDRFGARLLPTGMHPFLDPATARIWPRSGRPIYETYARAFDVRGHGWMNVQSCHLNLPFGSEEETALLHNAICCLTPYLPALTASSPIYGGAPGPYVCNRLAFYRDNQRRIPQIAGDVIPEYMTTYARYRREILEPIYGALDRVDSAARLKHEWVNSRGAILRFSRKAIEIRTLDTQECVRMDIAVAVFVRSALAYLTEELREQRLALPPHGLLVEDFNAVIRHGSRASVQSPHLGNLLRIRGNRPLRPTHLLERLLEESESYASAAERAHLPLVSARLEQGNLSERILGRLRRVPPRTAERRRDAIRGIYQELAACLETNSPW